MRHDKTGYRLSNLPREKEVKILKKAQEGNNEARAFIVKYTQGLVNAIAGDFVVADSAPAFRFQILFRKAIAGL